MRVTNVEILELIMANYPMRYQDMRYTLVQMNDDSVCLFAILKLSCFNYYANEETTMNIIEITLRP